MSGFGRDDPRDVPIHFFYGSLRVDYDSAVRADPAKQNCSICPRSWYIVIDQLYEIGGELPDRINENRRRLGRQIARLKESSTE